MQKTPTRSGLLRFITHARATRILLALFVFVSVIFAIIGYIYTARPSQVSAATSTTLNFQSRLLSNSGQVVPDGYYNIEFNLYTVSSGGAAAWTETRDYNGGAPDNRVRVVNGYLTVNLGDVNAFGALNWDQEHWLGMTVRGSGACSFAACTPADSEMTPRMKLTAVPYAFRAGAVMGTGGAYTADNLVQLAQAAAQAVSSGNTLVQLNQTGAGGLLTLQAGGNNRLTLSNAGVLTVASTGTFQGASITVGTASQAGSLILNDGTSNTATLSMAAFGQNSVITLPDPGAGTDTICLQTLANCAGSGDIVQDGNSFGEDVVIGANDGYGVQLEANGTTVLSLTSTGQALFKNVTNSTTALQVQNAAGSQILNVDTSVTNLLTNPSIEQSISGNWVAKGASTVSQDSTQRYIGLNSLKVITTAAANDGAQQDYTFSNISYNLTFYAKLDSGSAAFATMQAGYNRGSDTSCITAQTVVTGGWIRYSCTFTPSAGAGHVYIKQTDANAHTYYIDGVQLVASSSTNPYREGNIAINAVVNSPIVFQNQSDSTTALQVQNAAGTSNLLVVDTLNGKIGIGTTPTSTGQILQVNGTVSASSLQINSGNLELTSAGNGTHGITKGAIADNAITANQVVVITGSNGSNQITADLTTTARDRRIMGVAANTVSAGGQVNVKVFGYATVDVDTSAVVAGDQLVTSTTSGRATVDNGATTGIIGYALSTKAGGSNGTVTITVRPISGQYSPIYRNASDSTTAFQIQNAAGTSNLVVADTTNTRLGIGKVPTQGTLDVNGDIFATNVSSAFTVSAGSTITLDTASASSGNIRKRETAGTGGVTASDVVVRSSDGKMITTTTPRDPRVYGISVSTLALNAQGSFVISGNGQVTAKTADAIAIGDQLVTSDVAGAVTADNNATTGILGYALSAKGAGVAGTVNVSLNVHGGQSSPVFRNTSDSATAFQIQNAGGTAVLLNADTSAGRISVGTNGTDTGQFYVGGQVPAAAAGSVSLGAAQGPINVFTQGRYIYVADFDAGNFKVVDASNPASPVVLGTRTTGTNPVGIYVQDKYAYVTNRGSDTLTIYDVSNPASIPAAIGSIATDNQPYDVYVSGKYAYVIHDDASDARLRIYDVSNPAAPTQVSNTGISEGAKSIYVSGKYAYIASNPAVGELAIWDISNPASPSALDVVTVAAGPYKVIVQGKYAYVSSNTSSQINIVDISDPTNMPAASSLATTGGSIDFDLQGRYMYVTNFDADTLQVIDVANPASPASVGTVTTGTDPRSVVIVGRYAYVANYTSNTIQSFDMGGAYIQQLETGGIETNTLQTTGNANFGNDVEVRGGLSVAGSTHLNGNLGVLGTALFQNASNSSAAFSVQNASGTNVLKVNTTDNEVVVGGGSAAYVALAIDSAAGQSRDIVFRSAGLDRWIIRTNSAAESGSNAGSNFEIINRDDAGSIIGTPLVITRSNGAVLLKNTTNSGSGFQIQQADGSTRLAVDTQDGGGLLIYGNSSDELFEISSTAGLQVRTSGTTAWTNLGTHQDATNILNLYNSSASTVASVSGTGATLFRNSADSTTAFQIQNAAGTNAVFTANTTNGRIGINTSTTSYDLSLGGDSARTLGLETRSTNAAGSGLTISAGAAGSGGSAFTGGTLTLQGGAAGGTGNAVGGSVTISGGAGVGTGVQGLVNLSTSAFTSATTQSFGVSGSLTSGLVDQYSTIPVNATAAGLTVTIPVPHATNQVIGRLLYVAAVDNSNDFTISLGGTSITIVMKENSTATLIWNGTGWTAAGASSSTDLQSAYNNTIASAGGAELVLNAPGGAADGLTIRNNGTTPITGGLLEVQTSIGSNLFAVNNNATEYATNGGAETAGASASTFPSNTWDTTTGGTVDRWTTVGDNIATGQASVRVQTTTTNHGARNRISTALTTGLTYTVSFAARGATNFSTLQVLYSPDGTTSGTTQCATTQTVTQGTWSRITCSFVASGTIDANNSILIRQTDATARTFYIDNLSINVNASATFAADGSVDSALGSNWTAFGTLDALTRETTIIYDTSGSVAVDTPNATDRGVRNNLSVTPAPSTQYLVTFYARSTTSFSDIRVRYTRDAGTNFVSCVDYNTQTVSTSAFTEITCLFTTDSTTATNPDLVIDQPTGSDRIFYIDALSVTLNTNTSNNVQIGGANKGGPVTLLTLDRSNGAPIAANNEAYLGSMYYDTSSGRIQCYEADGWGACGAAPDNIVNLNPEYAGAVLNGSGVGTMTADLCSNDAALSVNSTLCGTGEAKNYYRWTSPQASQQTYSVYVSYQLPATFNGFASDDTVQLVARTDSTTNAAVTYEMFKSTGSAVTKCGSGETTVVTTANTWQSVGINGNESTGCSFTASSAGNFLLFKINLKANSNANAYVSTLSFTTTGR